MNTGDTVTFGMSATFLTTMTFLILSISSKCIPVYSFTIGKGHLHTTSDIYRRSQRANGNGIGINNGIRETSVSTWSSLSISPSFGTALYVATKSGGRAILSEEQFNIEVLNQIDFEIEDEDLDDDFDDEDDEEYDDDEGEEDCKDNEEADCDFDVSKLEALAAQEADSDAGSRSGTEKSKDSSSDSSGSSSNESKFNLPTKPILVFFSAPWCGPCRLSNPIIKDIIKRFVPRIDVVEVCTDDLPEVAEGAGVVSIPTIQLYYEGRVLDTIVGCVAKNVLGNAVVKILEDLGLDGDEKDKGKNKQGEKKEDKVATNGGNEE